MGTCELRGWEKLRLAYKPPKVGTLFVGESPPAGGTFFYAGNSILLTQTQTAFSAALETCFQEPKAFLRAFQAMGCYLEDLCLEPINNLPKKERRFRRQQSIPSLATRLQVHAPHAIVIVHLGVEDSVRQAMNQAKLNVETCFALPFPAQGHQQRYISNLQRAIVALKTKGLLSANQIRLCLPPRP